MEAQLQLQQKQQQEQLQQLILQHEQLQQQQQERLQQQQCQGDQTDSKNDVIQPQLLHHRPIERVLFDSTDNSVQNAINDDEDDGNDTSRLPFEFKVPEVPLMLTVATNRRRSVRIQRNAEKRKSIAVPLPSPEPSRAKRRRTTINKKSDRQSIANGSVQGGSISKADHRKYVLDLLNKGDLKAIQVLPQIGMKTAYCIITHRYVGNEGLLSRI